MLKVINIMLGKNLGGIEQVFLDYSKALKLQNNEVINIVHSGSEIKKHLPHPYKTLRAFSQFDLFAALRLKKIIKENKIDLIITHGNRAFSLCKLTGTKVPIISVAHNYSYQKLLTSDGMLTISNDLASNIKAEGYKKPIFVLHNPIELQKDHMLPFAGFSTPPVVGFIGRLVHKKGVHVLLAAIQILNAQKFKIKAIIGGDGEEETSLKKYRTKNKLTNVKFVGWVTNKKTFFDKIDILVIPSLHEPFGVVILEGFAHGKPIIATNTEGPSEICTHKVNALIINKNSPQELADAIKMLVKKPKMAKTIAISGLARVQDFDILAFSRTLQRAIEEIKFNNIFNK
jgi:glycosyltransferase involved in cell wall biosynthesis